MPQLAVTINADGVATDPGWRRGGQRSRSATSARSSTATAARSSGWTRPGSRSVRPRSSSSRRATAPTRARSRPDASAVGRAVQVTLHPPRSSAAKAGPWTFGAKVTSEHDPSNRLVEEGTVVFLPFGALEADLRPAIAAGRFGAKTTLALANRATGPRRSRSVPRTGPTGSLSTSGRRRCRSRRRRPPCRSASPPGGTSSSAGPRPGRSQRVVRAGSADTPPVALTGTLEKRAIIPSGLPVAIAGSSPSARCVRRLRGVHPARPDADPTAIDAIAADAHRRRRRRRRPRHCSTVGEADPIPDPHADADRRLCPHAARSTSPTRPSVGPAPSSARRLV